MGDPTVNDNDPKSDCIEDGLDEMEDLNESDVEEVILDQGDGDDDQVLDEMGELELTNNDNEEGAAMNIEPLIDDAKRTFSKHKGAVFCVACDPKNGQYAASGGEDDKAFLWDISNGEVVLECEGHKDSVTCVAFSHDSTYLATADMSGLIQVWKGDSAKPVWTFETSDLEWMEWHKQSHVLLVGTADGEVWMFQIPSSNIKTFTSHGVGTTVGKILPDGKRACVGYQDGIVKIWDLKNANVLHTISGHLGHQESVTCMDVHQDNNLIITGSTDATCKLISSNSGKVLHSFAHPKGDNQQAEGAEADEDSIEAVGFNCTPNPSLAASGTLSGRLTIWDLSTQQVRHTCEHNTGIVRLYWDSQNTTHIYTCTLDGLVQLWDARTASQVKQWSGHKSEILDLQIVSDGSHLITASEDGTCKVFTTST